MTGKSIIELTNVNTGETRKYEDKNMITNAVQERLTAWLAFFPREAVQSKAFPLYAEMFGGILLYDKPLEENPNNYDLPDLSVSRLVGHAGKFVTNGDNKMRGSRNTTESGFINDKKGYKYVYDFATDEANGQISALSLTHEIMGYYGNYISWADLISTNTYDGTFPTRLYDTGYYGNNTPFLISKDTKFYVNMVESEKIKNGNKISYLTTNLSIPNSTTIRIEKYELDISNIRLNNRLVQRKLISRTDIPITISVYDNNLSNNHWYYLNCPSADDNYYYFIYIYNYSDNSNNAAYSKIYYIKINKETYEITQGIKKIENYALVYLYNRYSTGNYPNGCNYVVRNGIFYFHINTSTYNYDNKYKILKWDTNSDEISIIDKQCKYNYTDDNSLMYKSPNNTIHTNGCLIGLDDSYCSSEEYLYGLDYSRFNTYSASRHYCDMKFVEDFISYQYFNSSDYYEHILPNICYLGTINNLDTPIIKTNEETMKITYILEEEE